MKYTAGFIGCGNMGGALARASVAAIGGNNIAVCDSDSSKLISLVEEYSATELNSTDIVRNCRFVFLGIKPQIMKAVLEPLKDTINESECVIITMAAGLTIDYYVTEIGIERPIIRIMPNTPCSIGEGMILYTTTQSVDLSIEEEFLSILSKAGKLDKIPETLIDSACAVAGCGPAFAFIFAEALADAGVECGLSREKAVFYAAQMLKGSASLLLENANPGALKDAVCSPGGSTIAGVHALEDGGFRASVMNAVVSAYKKTLTLK